MLAIRKPIKKENREFFRDPPFKNCYENIEKSKKSKRETCIKKGNALEFCHEYGKSIRITSQSPLVSPQLGDFALVFCDRASYYHGIKNDRNDCRNIANNIYLL
jgi:hypothetical protein